LGRLQTKNDRGDTIETKLNSKEKGEMVFPSEEEDKNLKANVKIRGEPIARREWCPPGGRRVPI